MAIRPLRPITKTPTKDEPIYWVLPKSAGIPKLVKMTEDWGAPCYCEFCHPEGALYTYDYWEAWKRYCQLSSKTKED